MCMHATANIIVQDINVPCKKYSALSTASHLANVVKVSVRCALLCQELLVSVQHHMQVELLLKQHQPAYAALV